MASVGSSSPPSRRAPYRLIAGLILPLVAFFVLLEAIGNATGALAVTDALPLLWVVGYGIWRRRIEWVGLAATVVFAIALGLTFIFGGSPLPLELRRAWFPGTVGLAFLISLVVRRPLLHVAAVRLEAAHPEQTANPGRDLNSPGARRSMAILTGIVGVFGTADAAAQIALALTVSTTHFVVLSKIASYTIIGCGLAVGALYVRHIRHRRDPPPSGAV